MQQNENKPLRYYHENWWKVEGDCIWYLAGTAPGDPSLKVGKWYFSDEAGLMNGPYDSREKAEKALKAYCEHL